MALWQLDEFQGPAFLGYVRGVPVDETFVGQAWLPNLNVDDLAFEYIKGAVNRVVMASVMGFDSEAPIAGRPGIGERVTGELPPIKRKAKFSEKELIRFLTPRANTSDKQTAINSVYNLTDSLLASIQARVEWLRIKALSEDTVVYNEGGVIFEFDFGLDEEIQVNFETGVDGSGAAVSGLTGVGWDNVATANPIEDLNVLQSRYIAKTGTRLVEAVLSSQALSYVQRNDTLREMVRGVNAPTGILTMAEINSILAAYQLPSLSTYDVTATKENDDGTQTTDRILDATKAFLVPATPLGNTLWGPTAESRDLIGTPLAAQAPGLIAKTYATEERPAEWVKAAAVAFPTMPNAHLLSQATLWA